MVRCLLTLCLFVALTLAAPQGVSAAATRTAGRTAAASMRTRAAIRQTPLLQRPNRPGHFYGNTVRRINRRRASGR